MRARTGFLLSFFMGWGLLATEARAMNAESDLKLSQAQSFSEAALQRAAQEAFMGNAPREATALEPLFQDLDGLVGELFPQENLRVTQVVKDEGSLRLDIEDRHSTQGLTLKILQAPSTSRYIIPATSLIVEESSHSELADGVFTNVAFGNLANDNHYLRGEAGLHRGAFSLSVMGAQLDQNTQVGVNANVDLNLVSGWKLHVFGQLSQTFGDCLNITQGSFRAAPSPGAMLNFKVDKVWSVSQIHTSVGVNLIWKDIGQDPDTLAYLGIGKTFKNSRGQDWGEVEVVASDKFSGNHPSWMIALQASFSF